MSRQARLDDLTRDEEKKDLFNPTKQSFCRACVDLSTFKKLKPESRQKSPYFLDPKGKFLLKDVVLIPLLHYGLNDFNIFRLPGW